MSQAHKSGPGWAFWGLGNCQFFNFFPDRTLADLKIELKS